MHPLPKWTIPTTTPAFHEFESATVLEQVSKVYNAMNTTIGEYNKFVDTVNEQLQEFTEEEREAREAFECKITKVTRSFQQRMEAMFEAELKTAAAEAVREFVGESGIVLQENYDPETESLEVVGGTLNG